MSPENKFQVVCDQLSVQMRKENGSSGREGVLPASTKIVSSKSYALMFNPDDTWSAVEYNMSVHALNNLEIDEVLQYYALIIEGEGPREVQVDLGEEERTSLLVGLISVMEKLIVR